MTNEPQKSALRSFQDRAANAGWRIQLIPYDDPSKPMRIQTNWGAVAGLLVVCIGFWGFWTGGLQRIRIPKTYYLWAMPGGLGFALVSLFVAGRFKRRSWLLLNAVCLDRDCRGDFQGWEFRLLCRFELEGKTYTVTPATYWRTFTSEASVNDFLAKVTDRDGTCCLRVNPRNPLETELAAGLADRILGA
jgi:hypothetical protein